MQIALIADAFPPMKTSGAVQIRDLVAELCKQGHAVTVFLPDSSLEIPWALAKDGNVTILRLKAMATKDVTYARRAIAEFMLSSMMYKNFRKSPLKDEHWEGIIWYSPTIFFGRLVNKLKKQSGCAAYLILRDIFPEWAVDMGLLKRGMIYRYFKRVEKFQYSQADTIGVQTPSIISYFRNNYVELNADIQVLNNWLSETHREPSSIQLAETSLAGRRIFVYTGNIGIAQGMDILMDLATACQFDSTIGFVIVGRGTAVEQIRKQVITKGLDNVLIFDEIEPTEIADLLGQCHAGLISLDPRHRNDNIPGKFLAYMQAGLPVLAAINAGNDLEQLINENQVGKVITSNSVKDLFKQANALLAMSETDDQLKGRCQTLANSQFSSTVAARQITAAIKA